MQLTRRFIGALAAVFLAVGLWSIPVQATVHEIVAQWCSGRDELNPPGISREGSKNFAQPLNAMGVVILMPMGDDVLITFDFDHPATKVQSSGLVIQIGTTPEGGRLLLDVPEPDPDFPAFQHCPALASM
jgi:hypothetical protein